MTLRFAIIPLLCGGALAAGTVRPAPRTDALPTGAYVLSRAASARPPIPFQFQLAGSVVAGVVDSARITLAADSSYTDKVTVRWTKAPSLPIPLPGFSAGPDPHTLTGSGRYTVQGGAVVLEPDDFVTKGFVRSVQARTDSTGLTLTGLTGGFAGSHVAINAVFTRVR
ncbi:MAG TPA: hypothetical protein VIC24_13335 [Gemmatimonadaceae bacterium]|jgi:hypothetical protein